MRHPRPALRSVAVGLALTLFSAVLGVGCGGSQDQSDPQTLNMVTVNWIEGMALTYVQEQILEDSLNMDVNVREVQGGGIAFSSVASGDRHFFNEAWLPTTHKGPWSKYEDDLQKLGYTYRGTTVGLAVPTYVDVDTIPDLANYRNALDGTINGIESGAAINDQARRTLERYDMDDDFSVAAASGPATWQALESAVAEEQPIVVTAWYPHWKWTAYDLKYVDGAKTNHNVDIWGKPEAIFTIVETGFAERFPKRVVCFLQTFEANDDQIFSLMRLFNERGDRSKAEAAQQWIQEHRGDVSQWLEQAESCTAADTRPQPVPDSTSYSGPATRLGS